MRGATTIYLDAGSDMGNREVILKAITEALPTLKVVPLFAANMALFYDGAPPGAMIDAAPNDPKVGFGMVSRPDGDDWTVARVLLMRGGTAIHFANEFIKVFKEHGGQPATETPALVC
jgi:hypothetical protein